MITKNKPFHIKIHPSQLLPKPTIETLEKGVKYVQS